MRTVIVLTAYRREEQLQVTLKSFERYAEKDYDVFIEYDDAPDKLWVNSSVAYNIAFHKALKYLPNIVIIQNGECCHAGDIIGYAEKHLTDKNYISFGCYSLPKDSPIPPVIRWNQGATFDGESAWYNHPVYRHVGYHFCSAITARNLYRLNGFDERLWNGIGYEDNLFLHQVRSLGLQVEITEEPFVYHQWHDHSHNDKPELIKMNKDMFEKLSKTPFYRGMHLITPDLC